MTDLTPPPGPLAAHPAPAHPLAAQPSTTALALLPAGGLRVDASAWVVWAHNPMAPADLLVQACAPGLPLGALAPQDGGAWVCWAGGEWLPRERWGDAVRPGEVVLFLQVAGGRGLLRAVLGLVVLGAALYFGAGLGAFIGEGLGLSLSAAQAAALGSAVIQVAGTLIVNALVPLRPASGGQFNAAAASPTYSIALQGNNPRLGQPVPVGYGALRTFPDVGCAYSDFAGDSEQYYNAVLVVGLGAYQILAVEIGDTDVRNFQEVEVRYWGPGQTLERLGFGDPVRTPVIDMLSTEAVGGQELDEPLVWIGPFSPMNPGVVASSREVYTDLVFGQGLADINPSNGTPRTLAVTFELEARPVSDRGQPEGTWVPLLWRSMLTNTLSTPARVERATRSAVRESLVWELPNEGGAELTKRWEFRMRRTSGKSSSQYMLDSVQWGGLRARGRLRDKPLADSNKSPVGFTGITLRVRATAQLSGLSQRRIAVYWRRLLPVWRGASFSAPVFSDRPVDVAVDVLCNTQYGRALPVAALDMPGLAALRATHAARQDRCNYVFDTLTTAHEAASLALRCGRTALVQRMGRITAVRDEPQPAPVAMFTPYSMAADSLVLASALPAEDEPLSVRMTYLDNQVWAERAAVALVSDAVQPGTLVGYAWIEEEGLPASLPAAVRALVAEATAPDRTIERPLPGVTGRLQAMREALFAAGVQRLRRENVSFGAGLEGLLVAWGDAVLVAHDVVDWGQTAEVAHWDATTRTLLASEPLAWQAGATHYVRLLLPTGEPTAPLRVERGLYDDALVLQADPPAAPVHDDPLRERTRLIFGAGEQQGMTVRLQTCAPQGGELVNLGGYVEVPEVHALDAALLPVGPEVQDPPNMGASNVVSGADPNQADVVFLSNFASETAPLVDASGNFIPLTLTGGAVLVNEPDASLFGGRALELGGRAAPAPDTPGSARASTPVQAEFAFGNRPWTWEAYIKLLSEDAAETGERLLDLRTNAFLDGGGSLCVGGPGRRLHYRQLNRATLQNQFVGRDAGQTLALLTRYHVAVQYDGAAMSIYVNGQRQGEPVPIMVSMQDPRALLIAAASEVTKFRFRVWGVRLTANVARYSANFTPGGPWPLPAVTATRPAAPDRSSSV